MSYSVRTQYSKKPYRVERKHEYAMIIDFEHPHLKHFPSLNEARDYAKHQVGRISNEASETIYIEHNRSTVEVWVARNQQPHRLAAY